MSAEKLADDPIAILLDSPVRRCELAAMRAYRVKHPADVTWLDLNIETRKRWMEVIERQRKAADAAPSGAALLQERDRLLAEKLRDAVDLAAAEKERDRLAAEVAELRWDAERYRIWRDDYANQADEEMTDMMIELANCWTADQVDAAIDAAIRARSQESNT